jgi:hypothetical protein
MTVTYINAPGTLTWTAAANYAKSIGARLPTKDEITDSVEKNGNQPIYHKDIWVPAIDTNGTWVSVGNFDPANRLGKTHNKACGCKPAWSDDATFYDFRTQLGVVYTKVILIPVSGTLTYSGAKNHATSLGARLATKAEIRALVQLNNNQPLVGHDAWVPAHDLANDWVSIGNFDPANRLGNAHSKLFGLPAWSEDGSHHAFRSHIAVVFESQFAANKLRFVAVPGTLGWHAANQYALSHGSRLPTKEEVSRAIQANYGQPLFGQDIWVPVSDAADTWVSVGNFDPANRLGKTHNELFGAPEWSNDGAQHGFRSFIALVPTSNIVFIQTPGTHGFSAAQSFAASIGARLPSTAEAKAAVFANNYQPLFAQDIWIPVAESAWVSIGNFDPANRLGKTHTELFGAPEWHEDSSAHQFRTRIGVVFPN